ncbi:uncharacterized protein LOC143029448 [Oratosquilla oratoria]|uniref:uncharacterized protein LOC143029448 n=1 Tax=Oratosquilla oratoria TaxID=337810 RepID=UPI003F769C90
MIMAPVLAYERKSGGGSYDALRASREHAGLQQRLAAASAHKHEYGASQFDPSQSSFPQHYPSHYPPKKQYRSSSIEYQPDYSKGEYVGGDYVDSEYFQREYLRESRREYRKKSWSGEYGGETQDIYGKYLRSNSYGKENLRMSMRGDYPRPSSRASFGEEQFRESLVDFYYRTPRGSQDYQGFQEYLRGPLEEYLESRSMSRSYESGIGRDEREYLHNFTHPRERTPHRRRRSRESFSVPSTLTRDRRASVGWSMREPLSVREVLDGPHVFFRFCPSLPACHIPRASVRLPRRHSSR